MFMYYGYCSYNVPIERNYSAMAYLSSHCWSIDFFTKVSNRKKDKFISKTFLHTKTKF